MSADQPTGATPHDMPRRLALHWKILIGLLIGAVAGLIAHATLPPGPGGGANPQLTWWAENVARPVGQIFMRLIFMVVLPLLFSALVLGVAEMGDLRRLGRVGLRTLLLTIALSAISVAIGLGFVNLLKPGDRIDPQQQAALRDQFASDADIKVAQAQQKKPLRETLLDLIPTNPLQEAVGALDGSAPGGGMLAVMVFAVIIGVALARVREQADIVVRFLQGVLEVTLEVIGFAMRLAPAGVAALVFAMTATLGLDIVRTLGWFVGTVLLALAVQMFGIYPLTLALLARLNPARFFSQSSEALLTAFGTSSSNATLPVSLRVAEYKLKLSPRISKFVLTVGATANQNGTALYEGITVIFLAQVFGIDLTLTQQLTVAVMAILAGVGTAGVPGGSLPLIVIVLQQVGVPAEGIGVILGVDRLLDMCRTTLNVAGDLTIAATVDRSESRAFPAP